MKRISLGSDHAGWKLKQVIKEYLHSKTGLDRLEINDWGCYSEERCDYPDFAHKVAEDVENKKCDFGILICGSGNGIAMTVNKHQDIRAALCWTKEIAALARQHNDANIISIPARYTSIQQAIEMVDTFLTTSFEGGRHGNRVKKIACK
jgi:ribose 5-phosphate isomerase B